MINVETQWLEWMTRLESPVEVVHFGHACNRAHSDPVTTDHQKGDHDPSIQDVEYLQMWV